MGDRPNALCFFWFCCIVHFWNSLLTINIAFLSKINEADLLLAQKTGSWTSKVVSVLCSIPGAHVRISAFMSHSKINMTHSE